MNTASNHYIYARWIQTTFNYSFKNEAQQFTAPLSGNYKIELWGAQGAKAYKINDDDYSGVHGLIGTEGEGAYVSGIITLEKNNALFVYVGEYGGDYYGAENTNIVFNGGGFGESRGGGATDIRLISGNWNNSSSLASRIMVAGAGGGAAHTNSTNYIKETDNAGHGGGLLGYNANYNAQCFPSVETGVTGGYGYSGYGGNQLKGGTPGALFQYSIDPTETTIMTGTFGHGGYSIDAHTGYKYASSGGGGGYYGGGHGNHPGCTWSGGGGGSSFISGHTGSVAITSSSSTTPRLDSNNIACNSTSSLGYNSDGYNTDYTCSLHYSDYYFTNTTMIDGNGYDWTITNGVLNKTLKQMPNPNGGYYDLNLGHIGNGYARITFISE